MPRTPIHPGSVLADELAEIGSSIAEAARVIGVPPNRLSQIISAHRGVTADTALRLGQWLGTGPEFWMNLQKTYELDLAKNRVGKAIAHIPTYSATSSCYA